MTHPSGIQANADLLQAFNQAKTDGIRALQVVIENERMVLKKIVKLHTHGTWETDYDSVVLDLLSKTEPSYVLYRLDSITDLGYEWLLINWIPDNSNVRFKMLYASTRATLRKQFGDSFIKDDLWASSLEEVCLDGYRKYVESKDAPPPLTMAEEEMAGMRNNIDASTGLAFGRQTVGGVAFPLTKESLPILKHFAEGNCDYVQLAIDIPAEAVLVSHSRDRIEPDQIAQVSPANEGRYHLYRFRHLHDGQCVGPIFFIHSISGYKSSIKSRMLYSSCKSALLTQLEQEFGLQFDHRLETEDMDELTAESLYDTAHPKAADPKFTFEKPQGPPGRGPRRLIK